MTAYYPFWVLLIVLSLSASLGGFLWAYRHRQFTEQERARYLPLRNETSPAIHTPGRRGNHELAAMGIIVAIGIMAILLTIFVVVFEGAGGRL